VYKKQGLIPHTFKMHEYETFRLRNRNLQLLIDLFNGMNKMGGPL